MTKETNLSIATRIVANTPDKTLALSEIMNILGVTRSNAFVYYTKATKGVSKPAKETTEKTVSKTSVSMTNQSKRQQKLAEIDAFLASAPSSAANPFAALV